MSVGRCCVVLSVRTMRQTHGVRYQSTATRLPPAHVLLSTCSDHNPLDTELPTIVAFNAATEPVMAQLKLIQRLLLRITMS